MTIEVFLADDHTVVLDGLRFLLDAEKDIRVVGVASDGRDAVSQVREINPDVVIMDISMPELNGIEATQQIHDSCPSVRVIILSMHYSREHIYRALRAGAKGYLLKDSAGQDVVEAVRAVHAGSRYLSRQITETVIDDYVNQSPGTQTRSPLDQLTRREREILQLVVEGKSSAMIAEVLYLSPKTVETYRSRLMQKLEISDLPSLVKFAIRHGITSLDM